MKQKQVHKSNWLVTMLMLVMALLIPQWGWAQTASQPSEGDGSTDKPYIITKAAELAWFRNEVNGGQYSICAKIADNVEVIDLKDFCHAADASKNLEEKSWEPIGNCSAYRGTFDGNGKTITNLYIKAEKQEVGLFGYTQESTIKNLTIDNASVTNTANYTGILVGDAGYKSTLQNIMISTKCQVIGGNDYTGGIAGILDGNASNCVNYATVQGKEDVGGLFGRYDRTGNSITSCANYGNVTATSKNAGGLVGYFSSGTIQDCANYGDVKGTDRVAGMAGFVGGGKIQNVFSYGNVSATNSTQFIGMAFGYSYKGTTEGMVAYYSGAKLTVNNQEITVKAFGSGNLSEDNATGFTETQLRSGVVAYQLQRNASSEAKWGQNLANDGDIYPVIGSEHQVYADDVTLNCKTNEVVTGSFTNNTTSSAIRYQHGQTSHHAATDATCTEAGTKEYWQCLDCLRAYSDDQLTKELTDVTKPALGHTNNEDGYCKRCQHYVAVKPSLESGVYLIAKPYHLAWFRDYVNGTIVDDGEAAGTTHPSASAKLTADIDLKNYCHAAEDGKELLSWLPIANDNIWWNGNMDGQGHTISNLYIKTAQNYVGLFGFTRGATIQNLTFDYAKVENVSTTNTKTHYTGILAGYAYASTNSPAHIKGIKTTENCTVIGQEDTGGIVGSAKINLENCENLSSVKGTGSVGGIAGSSYERNIKRCTNYGTVENDGSGENIGGIIGYAYGTSIEDCANYGKITSTGWNAGGIAGLMSSKSSIQNVFSYGDVTYANGSGIIIGCVDGILTAKGIIAYNKEALLNNSSENIKIVGEGSLTFEDGKEEADVVKAFTKQQIKSGEVAWLLNGSTSTPAEGSNLSWYQKLVENGDDYPVLTSTGENTVYNGSFRYCDGTTSSYSNSSSDSELIHVASATITSPEFDSAKHIYHMGCSNEGCTLHKYFADADGTLEATKEKDGKFYVEGLKLTDASTAINTQAQFVVKNLQYSRQLKEGQTGYASLCLPFDINVADIIGAEECYSVGDMMIHLTANDGKFVNYILMLDNPTSIAAGKPMIVKLSEGNEAKTLVAKTQDVEYSANFYKNPAAKSLTLRDWNGNSPFMPICHDLASASTGGVFTTTTLEDGSYSLRTDGKFGMHTGNLSPYRMYLNIQKSQSAPYGVMVFSIGLPDDSSTTGIRIIGTVDDMQSGSSVKSSAIYTLNGQRVKGTPGKGIYIKNGKKFIVK